MTEITEDLNLILPCNNYELYIEKIIKKITYINNNEQELSLLKVSYDGLNEFPYLGLFYDEGTGAKLEMVPDGVAITNPRRQDNHWDTQSQVTDDCLTLEKGHSYIVRLTLKAPSDGTYQVQLGNWNTGTCAQYAVSVTARNEWQIIDVEFPNFDGFVDGDGCVVFLNGWVVGTTILKKIEKYPVSNDLKRKLRESLENVSNMD